MMIDLHSHILPGIDDGAKDWDEFLAMARIAVNEGVTQVVCTPHYIPFEQELTLKGYHQLLTEAKLKLAQKGLKLTLISGCEVFVTAELPRYLKQGKLLTINNGGKYLLIEFPRLDIPGFTKELLFELKLQGITPIIAHPERNLTFSQQPKILVELIEAGALCQLNTGSLTGIFGEQTQKAASQFLQSGMIHLLGSDAHSSRTRAPKFKKALTVIAELVGSEHLTELIEVNPLKVINGIELEQYPIELTLNKKSFWGWLTGELRASNQ